MSDPVREKRCTKCGETKDLADFYRQKGGRYGVHSMCKPCARERSRVGMAEWRKANPEAESEKNRRWALAHPETKRKQKERWAKANPEKVAARARRDRERNPEKFRERGRKYRKDNPAKMKQFAEARRAREMGAPGRGVSAEAWVEIEASACGLCAYCTRPARLEMDHVVPLAAGGAHDPDNVAAVCARCNKSKGTTPLLIWLVRRVA